MRRVIIAAWAIAVGAVALSAQLSKTDQAAIEAYQAAVRSAETTKTPRVIESAFAAVTVLRDALMQTRNGTSVLESLSEPDFRGLRRLLPGATIGREEIVFVRADVDYFVTLASARGDRVDRAFFAALKATRPNSIWPVYLERQTDSSGCTRYGSLSLVDTYRAWSDFQRRSPGRYAAGVKAELEAVTHELTSATCACGDAASVELELQRFLKDFPASPIKAEVDQRLKAVRAGQSDIRMKCKAAH
jgi:hypothetical protein